MERAIGLAHGGYDHGVCQCVCRVVMVDRCCCLDGYGCVALSTTMAMHDIE